MALAYSVERARKNDLWRDALIHRLRRLLEPDRPGQDEDHGERPHRRAQIERRHDPDRGSEHAAEEGPDRDRSPDDRAHRRVQASLEPDGHDRLSEADLVDVVDAA